MFRDEFEAEIDHLYQLCEELGRDRPELAPILGRNADPSVARLVEGLAFAFGRLRQRLDDDLPEAIHPIIDNLCAELLRPVPSHTVMALVPSAAKLLSKTVVSAGSSFATRPIDGVGCTFQSTVDVEVVPWSIARIDATGSTVRIELELFPGVDLAAVVPRALRLFFAHPVAAAIEARHLFVRHATGVVVRAPALDGEVTLDRPRAANPVHDGQASPIAQAFLDLRSYFVFPHGNAFVEIADFDRVLELGGKPTRLSVEITLDVPLPKGIVLDPTTVLLHAVPARNVFKIPDLRVPLTGAKDRCAVRPAIDGAQVYAIRDVALVNQGLQKVRVEPWARFFGVRQVDANEVRYEVRRLPSVVGDAVDVSLFFSSGPQWRREDQVAAEVSLLATNGERASAVGVGEVTVRNAASPTLVTFRNVTPVTRTVAPPLDGDHLWQFYRLLKASLASLGETLPEVLALANLAARARWPGAKPDATSFVALLAVERERDRSTVRDELRAGTCVRLTLDEGRFDGPGDLHLFGELLVALFTATLHPRHWVELTLVDAVGATRVTFPRAGGTRPGL